MNLIYKKVDKIIPYEKNPRHNETAVKYVAESIRQFGFKVPIVIDKNNVIVAGHTRLKAALQLGLTEVPCIVADDLNEAQIKAYRLADNRVAEFSTWNEDQLYDELKELEGDFNLDDLGFSDFLEEMEPVEVQDDDFDEDIFLTDEPESQVGDVYLLGRHVLVCGDSTKKETYDKLLNDQKVDLILTDPPYNVDYVGKTAEALKIKNDKKTKSEFYEFLLDAFKNMYKVAKEGCPCFVFHADREEENFRHSYEEAGFKWHQNAIWLKDTFVMGHSWMHYRYEPILIGWKEGAAHFDRGDRTIDNVLEFDRPKRSLEHPTMKPLDLIGWLIDFGSKKNDCVLDPFGGSGSTLISCEQANRSCYTIEIDPRYVDVIIKRYIRFKESANDCFLIRKGKKQAIPPVYVNVLADNGDINESETEELKI